MRQRLRRIHLAIRRNLQQLQVPPEKVSVPTAVNVTAENGVLSVSTSTLAVLKRADVSAFVPAIEGQQRRGSLRRAFFGSLLRLYDLLVRIAKRGLRLLRRIVS